MVGATLACLLAQQGIQVAVVEQHQPNDIASLNEPDLRVSAVNKFSVSLLEQAGIWPLMEASRIRFYKRLDTWEEPSSLLSFSSDDIQESYLGIFSENLNIQQAAWQRMKSLGVEILCPDSLKSVSNRTDHIVATLSSGRQMKAELLIGADGANSVVRRLSGIGTEGWQYQQHCFATIIKMKDAEDPWCETTWQAFNSTGPRAWLPLYGQYASLIWYDNAKTIQTLKALSDEQLKTALTDAFPDRLNDFDVLRHASFPLTRMHAKQYVSGRIVLVGDAAHTINPLAGQGVNLGFKDIANLYTVIANSMADESALKRWADNRYRHNLLMMSAMDVCYGVFSNNVAPLKAIRNVGLALANKAGPVKNAVLKYAMGFE